MALKSHSSSEWGASGIRGRPRIPWQLLPGLVTFSVGVIGQVPGRR